MATDFRALCAELADELDHNRQCLMDDRSLTHPLADRARAALAEPVAEPPAAPIPVSQRHPTADDCDRHGNCWWFDPHNGGSWDYTSFDWTCSHWLPAGALPRPGVEP